MSGELAYLLAVAGGVAAAFGAARVFPEPPDALPEALALRVRRAALVGGVLGAYLVELPADLLGWSAPAARGLVPLGGRTVLGGLLGGWGAVELTKARAGFRGATGDRFAVPLAVAMVFGRLGCVLRGCCEGVPLPDDAALGTLGRALHGDSRVPAALMEAWFHALAIPLLLVLRARGAARGARLALYLAAYAMVRFALEEVRAHPRVLLGRTYYQLLALGLFVLAAGTAVRRLWRTKRTTC
ncbi:MAG: prolipoprotein diacylglyceryl transferase family protein [Myxococcota bacterium]